MKVLDFGGRTVAVSLDATTAGGEISSFLDRAATDRPAASADLRLHVVAGADARLLLNVVDQCVTITVSEQRLSEQAADPTLAIAVLQAAARCLALVSAGECALLHGGAIVSRKGRVVAVLDGGRGQGKTSLALAIGLAGGQLLADEFLFTSVADGTVVTEPAPRLPWHVRVDMAPYLLPARPKVRLAFLDDFGPSVRVGAGRPTAIDVVFVPDTSRLPGVVRQVPRELRPEVLGPAVKDHRAKLLDPTLDHVSLFASADQLAATDGSNLTALPGGADGAADQVHALLSDLPVYLVGIGHPSEIGTSVEAAQQVLRSA